MEDTRYLVYYDELFKKFFWIRIKDNFDFSNDEYLKPILITDKNEVAQSVTHKCNLTLNS